MRFPLLLPVLLLAFLSLIWYSTRPVQTVPDTVDAELIPYLQRFVEEAAQRGVNVEWKELGLVFQEGMVVVDNQSFCGYTFTLGTDRPPYIEIARPCWKDYTEDQREILVFHELGHALLQRYHHNDRLPNGSLASLMNSLNTISVYDKFTPSKREYYLDELFKKASSLPEWAAVREQNQSWYLTAFSPADTAWQYKGPAYVAKKLGGGIAGSKAFDLELSIPSDRPLEQAAFWRYTKSHPPIAKGSKVVLSAKLRLDKVEGPGLALAVRGEHFLSGESPLRFSTRKDFSLNGTGYREVAFVVTDYFPDRVNALYVFLIMQPGSSGSVYFDDIVLEAEW